MNSENSEHSKPVPLDCALGAGELWEWGEDNDGYYVSVNGEQRAWAASARDAERMSGCLNYCRGMPTNILSSTPNEV